MTVIMLRTKPNRMGNSKRAYVYLDGNRIAGVTDAPHGSGGRPSVAPSEINQLITQAKRAGLFK